ncbi:MAG: hypothetical protein ACRCYE_14415 [Sarcina sp.]
MINKKKYMNKLELLVKEMAITKGNIIIQDTNIDYAIELGFLVADQILKANKELKFIEAVSKNFTEYNLENLKFDSFMIFRKPFSSYLIYSILKEIDKGSINNICILLEYNKNMKEKELMEILSKAKKQNICIILLAEENQLICNDRFDFKLIGEASRIMRDLIKAS